MADLTKHTLAYQTCRCFHKYIEQYIIDSQLPYNLAGTTWTSFSSKSKSKYTTSANITLFLNAVNMCNAGATLNKIILDLLGGDELTNTFCTEYIGVFNPYVKASM